ncbi:MAG: phosphonate ABC transporter, permease protein PhnE [Firmicutes bacterium]|nr:phosphonate ABC transporter, permease protein PhnE [Bacillota bacterium]MDY3091888.1 phosphonate ABC transporter, permease protein PhnE [Erysipelotrichaceae bacterium]
MIDRIMEVYDARPKRGWLYCIVTAIIVSLVIWSAKGINFAGITSKGSEIAAGMLNGLLHPDMSLLFSSASDGVPYLIFQTIAIAVLGTFFGAILAIPVSFLASENIVGKAVSTITRLLILLIRTIPSLVWALVWIRVTGPGPVCGVVTQSICSIGMISKMYITAIEDLDTRILESLDASGCNTFEKIWCGILPQLYASFISSAIYRFDINMKDATTLGIVSAGGIGASLTQCINSRRWSMVGSFLYGLIVLVMIIEWISTKIRRKLATGQ